AHRLDEERGSQRTHCWRKSNLRGTMAFEDWDDPWIPSRMRQNRSSAGLAARSPTSHPLPLHPETEPPSRVGKLLHKFLVPVELGEAPKLISQAVLVVSACRRGIPCTDRILAR